MKTLNRTLSLALVFALVFSLMSFAFAADTTATTTTTTTATGAFTDQASIKHTDAVSTMVALNAINGYPDGSFKPTENVTRGQMCKMLCILLNSGATPSLSTNATPSFTDIKGNWSEAYVEYCYKLGIVAGMGDGTFHPDDTVTVGQAAKMLLVALGYNSNTEGFVGSNWLMGVNVRANQKGLYKDITLSTTATLDRDNAAQMMSNGAYATEVEYDYAITSADGKVSTVATAKDRTKLVNNNTRPLTLVLDKYNLFDDTGIFTHEVYNSKTGYYEIKINGSTTTFLSKTDYSKYYGMNVRIFTSYDSTKQQYTVYGVSPFQSTLMGSGIFGLIAEDYVANAANKQLTSGSTTYNFDTYLGNIPVYAFNQYTSLGTAANNSALLLISTYEFIDSDNTGKIDSIIIYPYSVFKATYVGTTTATLTNTITNTSITPNLTDINYYTGMAKGDYVKITPARYTVANKDTYEKITTLDATVAKDSTVGTIHKVFLGTNGLVDLKGTMKVGSDYTGIAQVNGVIYDSTLAKSNISAKDYVLLIGAQKNFGVDSAKLLFSDGTTKDVSYNTAAGTTITQGTTAFTPYTYKLTTSTGVYTLTNAAQNNFDVAISSASHANDANGTYYKYSTSGSKISGDGTNSYNIDDNAVVFATVYDTVNAKVVGYKVLTGAQLKALATTSVLNVENVYGNTDRTTGFTSAVLAYVTVKYGATTAATSYGYVVTSGTALNSDKNQVSELKVWTGAEEKTILCDKLYQTGVANDISVGDIVSFSVNGDGSYTPTDLTTGGSLVPAAVVAYKESTGDITLKPAATSTTVSTTKTTIIYIDHTTGKYVSGGSISLANPVGHTGNYVNNCAYVDYDADHDLKVLVVDVKNYISDTYIFPALTDVLASDITNVFNEGAKQVTVNGNVTGDITVSAGQTLNVTGNIAGMLWALIRLPPSPPSAPGSPPPSRRRACQRRTG